MSNSSSVPLALRRRKRAESISQKIEVPGEEALSAVNEASTEVTEPASPNEKPVESKNQSKRKRDSKGQRDAPTLAKRKKGLVWAKLNGYPWWPARIINEKKEDIPAGILETKRKPGSSLVLFFGSQDYAFIENKNLLPFSKHFKENSKTRDLHLKQAIQIAIEDTGNEKLRASLTTEEIMCEVCKTKDNDDRMLLCDNCDSGYHLYCLNPPLFDIPTTDWYCQECLDHGTKDINVDSVAISQLSPGVAGLVNLGSTCYINSAIQCLNSCSLFRENLLLKENLRPDNELAYALQQLIENLWQGGVSHKLLSHLKFASGNALDFKYHGTEQQDLNEYLMQLMDYLTYQIKPSEAFKYDQSRAQEVQEKEQQNGNLQEASPINSSNLPSCNSVSLISECFDGVISRTRVCPSKHVSKSSEAFRILTLQFPPKEKRSKKKLLLQDMLKHLVSEEAVQCRCEECGGRKDQTFKQITEIAAFPKYLIIQLARFGLFHATLENGAWWSNKIETHVDFPLSNLDFKEIFPNSQQSPRYKLIAVANHKGNLTGGHYWAYCLHNNQWYNFNDNRVKIVSESTVQSLHAYMLFYAQIT